MLFYYISGIIILPGLILAIYAQSRVSSVYSQYSQIKSASGVTAYEMVRAVLERVKLSNIQIRQSRGHLTDYYDHKNQVIALSEGVFNSSGIAALGIAAHELGHVLQYADNYAPIKVRNILVPVVNFTSRLMWPLVTVGILLLFVTPDAVLFGLPLGNIIIFLALIFYGSSVLLSLAALPIEFDASRRATALLQESEILTQSETQGAKKVLNAAAWTYIATLVISLLQLLRILSLLFLRRRR